MSIIKILLLIFIASIEVIDGRVLRERRQAETNSFGQGVNNMLSYGYNTIRENVVPAVSSAFNRFSQSVNQNINQGLNQMGQTWDRYQQNLNQGVNQMGQTWDRYQPNLNQGVNQLNQGWNRFTQNLNQQYPYNNNNNAYRQYGYNSQQYPYNYNNMYQNYGASQGNQYQYPGNNYYNGYGMSRDNAPYYASNTGGQYYRNFGGQQRFRRAIMPKALMGTNQRTEPRRR